MEIVLLYKHHLVGANRLVVLALARQGHVDLFHLRVLIPCPHGRQGVVGVGPDVDTPHQRAAVHRSLPAVTLALLNIG